MGCMESINSIANSIEHLSLDELRAKICQFFEKEPIFHGQFFDDNRRWCVVCEAPVVIDKPTKKAPHNHMICVKCNSIWPEYVNSFSVPGSDEEDDFYEDI